METSIIPEFVLLDALNKGIEFVRTDYAAAVAAHDETLSYLYKVLGGVSVERYDHFTQGKKIFTSEKDDPRKLHIDLAYNMSVEKVPSIYIGLAAEQHGENGVSIDQGSREAEYVGGSYTPIFTRRQNTSYNIMIMSDNSNEVVLIYHFLKALLISLHPHLNMKGLENLTLSGQDLQLNSDLIPKHIYMRAINLGLQYEVSAPDLRANAIVNNLLIGKGIPSEI